VHAAPQKIPTGADVTVPEPVRVTVSVNSSGCAVNVAPTSFAASIVTTQLPVPEHAPDQPANVDEASGVAVSVTSVPSA
jgi:hypothetical protein